MDKIYILKLCIVINLLFLCIFISSFFSENDSDSSYFRLGWSDTFVFVSVKIDTPIKYFTLCTFITVLNATEVFLNEIACPIITFSTYNPYKTEITDFTRFELESFSNIIFFILTSKKLLQIAITLSQIDIAFISLISSQLSAYVTIKYLLDQKEFVRRVNIPNINFSNVDYGTIGDEYLVNGENQRVDTPIINI